MGKTSLVVLFVVITMINQYKSEPNFACTERGGYCSDSSTCPSSGGYVEKLTFKCKCGNACCKCTDICPNRSTCMNEGETCNGMKDTNGCCGTRFCCTPIMTTTPEPTTPIMTTTPKPTTHIMTTTPKPTTPIMTTAPKPCVRDCVHDCKDVCELFSVKEGECCGSMCCADGRPYPFSQSREKTKNGANILNLIEIIKNV